MLSHLAIALLITAVVAFAFKSTRGIGILCFGLFTFMFPWIAFGLLVIGFALFCYFKLR